MSPIVSTSNHQKTFPLSHNTMVRALSVLGAASGVAVALAAHYASPAEQSPLVGGNARSKAKDPFTNDFEALTKDIMAQWKIPGMSIAVIDGEDVFAKVRHMQEKVNNAL